MFKVRKCSNSKNYSKLKYVQFRKLFKFEIYSDLKFVQIRNLFRCENSAKKQEKPMKENRKTSAKTGQEKLNRKTTEKTRLKWASPLTPNG